MHFSHVVASVKKVFIQAMLETCVIHSSHKSQLDGRIAYYIFNNRGKSKALSYHNHSLAPALTKTEAWQCEVARLD